MLNKLANVLGSIGASCLMLIASPAKAQPNVIHQLGVLNDSDKQFESGSYFDTYEIEGSRGQRVSISLDSSDFDTYLGLLDSEGTLIASNDDAAADNPNSYLSATLPSNGTYTLVATSYEQQSGDYRMVVRNFSPPRTASSNSSSGNSGSALIANPMTPLLVWGLMNAMFSSGGTSSSSSSSYDHYYDHSRPASSGSSYSSPTPAVGGFYGNGPQHGTSTVR